MSKKTNTKSKAQTKAPVKATAKSDPDRIPLTELAKQKKAVQKEKKLSCLDAAVQVLKAGGKPMTCKAMIDTMSAKKLWTTDAPTPAATLYGAILRETQKKGSKARFKKTDRGLFALAA